MLSVVSDASPQAKAALELFNLSSALFVENQGQWDPSIRYLHQGVGANIGMTDSGPVFQVFRPVVSEQLAEDEDPSNLDLEGRLAPPQPMEMKQFSVGFVGAGESAVGPVGLQKARTTFNYQKGDESQWRSSVPSYEVVAYEELYPGIDLHTLGQRSNLKYEFHVDPGIDYSQIRIAYTGIEGLSISEDGSLLIELGGDWEPMTDAAPYVYQEIDGRRVEVQSRYVLLDERSYTFELGEYDADHGLVIDPELEWGTYLGGSSLDEAYDISVDASGSVLVTGRTLSTGWVSGGYDLTLGGDSDVFVVKLSGAGEHLWSSYLGGVSGEEVNGIALDESGNVLVCGATYSPGWVSGVPDLTLQNGADGFVAKLSSTGEHLWSTYVGAVGSIAVDGSGNVLVCGTRLGPLGEGDILVVKLSGTGEYLWTTYLGGAEYDSANGIAVDGSGNVLVCGATYSSGWISGGYDVTFDDSAYDEGLGYNEYWGRLFDGFVVKLGGGGEHLWSSYLGGSYNDVAVGIAADESGNVLVTGHTLSAGWISGGHDVTFDGNSNVDANLSDSFVVKLSGTGEHLWSSYLGGSKDDGAAGVAVDGAGNVLVAGWTDSAHWVSGGPDVTFDGVADGFVVKLSGSGIRIWSSYIGGSDFDVAHGIAVDRSGNVLITGRTKSSDWLSGGHDVTHAGSYDGFVVKISVPAPDHAYFEELAKGVAYWTYPTSLQGKPLPYEDNPYDYVVDRVFNDPQTSFYAVGLKSEEFGPVLALRGTDDWVDWTLANSDPMGVGYPQFAANWATGTNLRDWLLNDPDVKGKEVDITGHSLGGALAQWVAAALTGLGQPMGELVTFNSLGIAAGGSGLISDAGTFVPALAEKVTHYIVNGDPVSMFGEQHLDGVFYTAEFSDLSWSDMDKHNRPILASDVTKVGRVVTRPEDLELGPEQPVSILTDPNFSHDDPDMKLWVIAASEILTIIGAMVQHIELRDLPLALSSRLQAEAKRQMIGLAIDLMEKAAATGQATYEWIIDAGRATLRIAAQRGHDLWELVRPSIDSSLDFTLDTDTPPGFIFNQAIGLTLGNEISIDLPDWLGGPIQADHLVELFNAKTGGRIDTRMMSVEGDFRVLGSLLQLSGEAQLSWESAHLKLKGGINILDGLVTSVTEVYNDGMFMVGGGAATVSIPNSAPSWLFPGTTLTSAQHLFRFRQDTALPFTFDDFVAVWGWLGPVRLGIRIGLDNSIRLLGASIVEALTQQSPIASMSALNGEGSPLFLMGGPAASETYPIESGTNWALFSLDWDNDLPGATLSLTTPDGAVLNEADILADAAMSIVEELSTPRRRAVLVKDPKAGHWMISLDDSTGAGEVRFQALRDGGEATVSITRVAGGGLGTVRIDYEALSLDPDARVSLYYDQDDAGMDGVLIADGLDGDGGSHLWDTSSVPAGSYYIYAVITDGSSIPGLDYSEFPVVLSDVAASPPILVGNNAAKSVAYTDADGTVVTITVKGGQGAVQLSGEDLVINATSKGTVVTGTNVQVSHFFVDDAENATVAVTTKGGDGRTTFGGLTVDGTAASIKMPGVDLDGDLLVTGRVKSLAMGAVTGDAANQRTITLGGSPADKASVLTFTRLTDVELNSDAPVQVTLFRWSDSDPDVNPDSLNAPWATTLTAKGDAKNGIPGLWAADVNLTGNGATRETLKTFRAQSLSDSILDIVGALGTFDVSKGSVEDLTLDVEGDAKTLKLGDVSDSSLDAEHVGSLQAIRWIGGEVTADSIKTFKITGHTKMAVPGDLDVNLTIDGDSTAKSAMGSATIAGLLRGQWQVQGPVGAINAGDVDDFTGNVSGAVNALVSKAAFSGLFAAFSFAKIDIKTNLADAKLIAGGNPASSFINTLKVGGNMTNSSILVGVDPVNNVFGDPDDLLLSGSAHLIKSLTIGGITDTNNPMFFSGLFPISVTINKLKADPSTDQRFVVTPV